MTITEKREKVTLESEQISAVRYYYHKLHGTRRVVCLLFRTDPETGDLYVVARGVARCSRSDQFNKTTGRNIARGRALSACHYKCDRYGGAIGGAITAVFQPLLGEFEQRIMVSVDKQFRSISDGTDTDRLRGW